METSRKVAVVVGSVIALAIISTLSYSIFNSPSSYGEPEADVATQSTGQPADESSEAVTIVFTDNGFSPRDYTAKAGQTILVINDSASDLQFSSDDHPTHRLHEEMNLRILAPGESASFTITKTGRLGFHDHIRDQFTGQITVSE